MVARAPEIASALAALGRRVGAGGAGALVLDAPARPLDVLFRLPLAGARHLWDDAEHAGEASIGEVLRVEASGPSRFAEIEARGTTALGRIEVARLGAEQVPGPRLVGGFAFRAGEAERARGAGELAPWAAFADASFVVPRWTLGRAGARGWLRVVATAEELAAPERLAGSIAQALDAIERAGDEVPDAPLATGGTLDDRSAEAYEALVAEALAGIRAGLLEKVVVARASRVVAPGGIDPLEVLARLARGERRGVRFAFERDGAVFLGATPERLVVLERGRVRTEALAGTIPRREGEDDARAAALLASEKDRREHAAVVAAIASAMAPLVRALDVPAAPVVRTLRHVHHLATPISGDLARGAHVLALVERLHPTPAVGGVPRDRAVAFIAEHEPAPRGWYAAPVGWFDAEGQGSFAVAIRSGLLAGATALVYAGAGIVAGSEPRQERLETQAKQAALLAALGVA